MKITIVIAMATLILPVTIRIDDDNIKLTIFKYFFLIDKDIKNANKAIIELADTPIDEIVYLVIVNPKISLKPICILGQIIYRKKFIKLKKTKDLYIIFNITSEYSIIM
jgi:hypothetical protein